MSKSPFYKTGISKSPLYDTTHGEEGHAHPHTLKQYRAKRKGEIDKMQAKLNSMSVDENTIKPGMEEAYDKLSAKINAHDLETTKKVRNIQ